MSNKIYKLLSIFICLSFVVLLVEDVFFKDYFDNERNKSPSQRPMTGLGSGFVIDETGIIVPLMEDGENNLEHFENAILELSQNKSKMEYLAKNSLKRAKEIFSEEETLDKTYKVFMRHAKS